MTARPAGWHRPATRPWAAGIPDRADPPPAVVWEKPLYVPSPLEGSLREALRLHTTRCALTSIVRHFRTPT